MRFTIERIRTLVVAAAVLLVVAIAAFLGLSKFTHRFIGKDIPERLGINIQQEANGVTYTQAHGGHTLFKIHASRVVQLRNNHATLHDVVIELYGKDGAHFDRIQGAEFEYDQKTSIATASGQVQIELQRPVAEPVPGGKPAPPGGDSTIRVRTSGITFNQATGIMVTSQRVQFLSGQGSGSALGASYDSELGFLVLNREVELTTTRGDNPVTLHAEHAEFNRDTLVCTLRQATTQTRGEQATVAEARILFRDDGSVERLDGSSGLTISTESGSRLAAPAGLIEFTAKNEPKRAHFEGGVTIESVSTGRTLHGAAPTMDLAFTSSGDLRLAHLERGVQMQSLEQSQAEGQAAGNAPASILRTWNSPVAEVNFRTISPGKVEPATLYGTEGVVITSETRRPGAAPVPSRLAADNLTGQFGPRTTLTSMTGIGHASIDQTNATGAHQKATGDRLEARFNPVPQSASKTAAAQPGTTPRLSQFQTAQLDGHVVLINQPAAKADAQPQQPMRAIAGRAQYETVSANGSPEQWLHLTMKPRVTDGGIDLTADQLDIAQSSGEAFARGNVKATWASSGTASQQPIALGGTTPAHVVAAEAQLHQSTGEATFRGHARLWQDQNSISAPIIILNRQQQTLTAQASTAAEPVLAVLLSAEGPGSSSAASARAPSVIRVRTGDLRYSAQDRKALLRAAPLASVTAQTGTVESSSDQLELYLLAPTGTPGASSMQQARVAGQPAPSQIDRVIAQGHVSVTSQGRRGTGQQLVYTARTGNYVLTGTPATPPRMTDPLRGSVTGQSLLFNSRDDSVSIEGGSQPTTTQTTVPR